MAATDEGKLGSDEKVATANLLRMASNFERRKSTPRATFSLKDVVKIPGNLSN